MDKRSRIFIAGHNGLVGSAVFRALKRKKYTNLILKDHSSLDLKNQKKTLEFFKNENPEYVFLAAAKVGGIMANSSYPASFIYDNLIIQTNIINSAHKIKVRKLLFLGSSCIYPKFAPQPIKEEYFLDGKLEKTNEPYAVAKIAGIIMCQAYCKQYNDNIISLMPTNLYGINDNFDLESSHVLPALIRKFYEAKINAKEKVEIWGTGSPRREFLFVDDLADAMIFLMEKYNSPDIINVGTGKDIMLIELANIIKKIVGYDGDIYFNTSKPDGTPRKQLNIDKITSLGWKPKYSLKEGIKITYDWYVEKITKNK